MKPKKKSLYVVVITTKFKRPYDKYIYSHVRHFYRTKDRKNLVIVGQKKDMHYHNVNDIEQMMVRPIKSGV